MEIVVGWKRWLEPNNHSGMLIKGSFGFYLLTNNQLTNLLQKIDVDQVLHDIWAESNTCVLVYATEEAMEVKPLAVGPELDQFVAMDNTYYEQELAQGLTLAQPLPVPGGQWDSQNESVDETTMYARQIMLEQERIQQRLLPHQPQQGDTVDPTTLVGNGTELADFLAYQTPQPKRKRSLDSVDSMSSNRAMLSDDDSQEGYRGASGLSTIARMTRYRNVSAIWDTPIVADGGGGDGDGDGPQNEATDFYGHAEPASHGGEAHSDGPLITVTQCKPAASGGYGETPESPVLGRPATGLVADGHVQELRPAGECGGSGASSEMDWQGSSRATTPDLIPDMTGEDEDDVDGGVELVPTGVDHEALVHMVDTAQEVEEDEVRQSEMSERAGGIPFVATHEGVGGSRGGGVAGAGPNADDLYD